MDKEEYERIREILYDIVPTYEQLARIFCADEMVDLIHNTVQSYCDPICEKLNEDSKQFGYASLSDLATNPDDFSSDIPSLKKRIKYCKNPLERKSLERQLNTVYKAMKKRR